jgi:cell division control protein 6
VKQLFYNGNGNGIIAKEEILMPDYAPPEALHREAELQEIAAAIKPLLKRKKMDNLFIYGPSGTGKTLCAKLLLEQLKEQTSKVLSVYANCWEYPTQMAVYSQIHQTMELALPRRGLATDEVFDSILETMKKENVTILMVLDEIDSLTFHREQELLYTLARANEKDGILFGIIGISNNVRFLANLDMRIRSSLRFTQMEFKEYTQEQLISILKERAKLALAAGAWDDSLLQHCARVGCANGGNARLALELLWKSAKHAEKRDARKIEFADFEAVLEKTTYEKKTKEIKHISFETSNLSLSEEERLILEILMKGEKTSTQLYDEFQLKITKTKRQIRNYISLLEAKGIIETAEIENPDNNDSMLKPRLIRLKETKKGG